MTATPAARGRRGKQTDAHRTERESAHQEIKPLAPQRKLFVTLMIVLAVWIAILLVMYFTTVW